MRQFDGVRLDWLCKRFPKLGGTIAILNANGIHWMIGGSGCLYLMGNEREPGDVDILLPNDQHDSVDRLFGITSFTYRSQTENVRNSNPNGDHDLQFTSQLAITIEGKTYKFNYGDTFVQEHVLELTYNDVTVRVAPPEEAILVKSILQRGAAEGKHDIEDVERFLGGYGQPDTGYLAHRIEQLSARKRTRPVLAKWL